MLSDQLRTIRRANRYTQQQVSDILNIERSTYASYETGRNRPDVALLQNFAKIFNVTVDFILNIDPQNNLVVYDDVVSYKKKANAVILSDLTKEEREIIGLYRLCDDDGKKEVKEFLGKKKKSELRK